MKDATPKQKLVADVLQKNLLQTLSAFFIRKTKEQVQAVDVSKTEVVLWMNASPFQIEVYNSFIKSKHFQMQISKDLEKQIMPFQLITILRKICDSVVRLNQKELLFIGENSRQKIKQQTQQYQRFLGPSFNVDNFQVNSDEEDEYNAGRKQQILSNYYN